MKSKYIVFVVVLVGVRGLAQDIHFSQMSFSPLNLNPALAGSNYDLQASVNYKSQWKSVAVPYKTIGASFDSQINRKKAKKGYFAAGLNFFNDNSGDNGLKTTNASLNVAYHLFLNSSSTLGGGVYGSFGQRQISFSDGKWGSQYDGLQYDAALPTGEAFKSEKFTYPDFGSGIVYSYRKDESNMTGNDQLNINAGVSVFHLAKPNYSFVSSGNDKLDRKWSFFANVQLGTGTSLSILPGIYYIRQGKARELLAGTYVRYTLNEESKYTGFIKAAAASVGLFYRNRDALIVKGMFEWSNYGLGVAYDLNTSNLAEVSNRKGGVEFFLKYVMPSPFSSSRSRI